MENETQKYHQSVLLNEAIDALMPESEGIYIDCTLGDGGHSEAILKASSPAGRLIGIDADPEALAQAEQRLEAYRPRARFINNNFAALAEVAWKEGLSQVNGVLLDLGVSARQLDTEKRGFSFRRAEFLDMRFSPSSGVTADEIVNSIPEAELVDALFRYGEEPRARRIASAIVSARPIKDSMHLAEVIKQGSGYKFGKIHPATRTFQALRILVNQELEKLEQALVSATSILINGGRLVAIAYHSLEDRVIKNFIRSSSNLERINKKVIRPSKDEIQNNRRSRSARMRIAERQAE
tara:strand:+ start:2293 stop:3177 length:885 start_codon:yes stop_codon:yes gene_type:complete